MIKEMRDLALSQLNHKLCGGDYVDMETLRLRYAKELASYLVEDSGRMPCVYVLRPIEGGVRLYSVEMDEKNSNRVPFVKPSGARSAAIGPVIKRTYDPKKKPPFGPKAKTLEATLKAFQTQASAPSPWQAYFQEVVNVLANQIILFEGEHYAISEDSNMLIKAIELIGNNEKETVFITVATFVEGKECWPGDRKEYHEYLAHELATRKYVTDDTPAHENSSCSLCDKPNVSIYSNAVKGAGINIGNTDRAGAFAAMNKAHAWKNYGLCLDCADLLYVFKNYALPELLGKVAGEPALLLPSLLGPEVDRIQFMEEWQKYLGQTQGKALKKQVEKDLLTFFKEQNDAHLVIQIIWANFEQNMTNVNGYITDILPSRLHQLSELNAQANKWQQAFFPKIVMDEAGFDLHLKLLWPLFKRLGGKKADNANKSKQLRELKQQLAAKIYHGEPLDDHGVHFWQEIMITARCYVAEALNRGDSYGLCYEGYNHKKQIKYWTLAGWIRHVARFIYYLEQTGVLPMTKKSTLTFEPAEMPQLKALFAQGSGINSDEKAFAFLIGILYGKLLQVQSAKEVNVITNTLPWLKRLQLSGKDLPELYTKICHKFLVYGKTSQEIQKMQRETARVGKIVGDEIHLDSIQTCYFLLLGQALVVDVLPPKFEVE